MLPHPSNLSQLKACVGSGFVIVLQLTETDRCCRLFSTKYIVKMIRYVEKDVPAVLPRHLGNEPPKPGQLLPTHKMDHRQSIRLADQLTDLLMPAAGMPPRDASRPLRATLEEAIALALISSDKVTLKKKYLSTF